MEKNELIAMREKIDSLLKSSEQRINKDVELKLLKYSNQLLEIATEIGKLADNRDNKKVTPEKDCKSLSRMKEIKDIIKKRMQSGFVVKTGDVRDEFSLNTRDYNRFSVWLSTNKKTIGSRHISGNKTIKEYFWIGEQK